MQPPRFSLSKIGILLYSIESDFSSAFLPFFSPWKEGSAYMDFVLT